MHTHIRRRKVAGVLGDALKKKRRKEWNYLGESETSLYSVQGFVS